MKTNSRRIGLMVGAGYVPGINAVITGSAIAASKMGWELVGIRDGFDGLLHPEKYPHGGLVTLDPELIENLDPSAGGVLGQSARVDPFHVRQMNELEMVEGEVDMSDELLKRLKTENIDGLISVVGGRDLRSSTSCIAKVSIRYASHDRLITISPLLRFRLVSTAP